MKSEIRYTIEYIPCVSNVSATSTSLGCITDVLKILNVINRNYYIDV